MDRPPNNDHLPSPVMIYGYRSLPVERDSINLPASTSIDEILQFIELKETVFVSVTKEDNDKEKEKEPCKRIYLHAFRGARDPVSRQAFKKLLAQHEEANTSGPSGDECLLYTGHVGISFDAKSPIYGFNPDTGSLPGWLVISRLKDRDGGHAPYPGVVTDDTSVFSKAKAKKLEYKTLEYVFPESEYNKIHTEFNKAKSRTGLTYSFPGQGGDCNCATWPGQIGLPIPCGNGNMKIYISSFEDNDIRKMGDCDDK